MDGDEKTQAIPFNYCVLSIIMPFVYFLPKLMKHSVVSQLKKEEESLFKDKREIVEDFEAEDAHPTDIMNQLWKDIQKEREEEDKKKQSKSVPSAQKQEEKEEGKSKQTGEKSKLKPLKKAKGPYEFEALDQILCRSVCSIQDKDLRHKLANSILLVGGGSKFDGFSEIFQDRLIECIQQYDETIERIEVITPHTLINQMKKIPLSQDPQGLLKKELASRFNFDPQCVGWGGAAVISKIDYSKELYITREKWLCERKESAVKGIPESDGGFGALKQRSAFLM